VKNGLKSFTRLNRVLLVRLNTARPFRETSLANSYAIAPILHTTSITTIIDTAATEIRVALFDMVKQKSNSAIKNVATLSRGGVFT
jgi:hypothetical protein